MIYGPVPAEWAVLAASIAIAAYELGRFANRWLETIDRKWRGDYALASERLTLDREIFQRVHPEKAPEASPKRMIVVPPEIESQLADAPEWEREDTRARAVELYEELERKLPDDKPQDRWGRVHKLLELETEAVLARTWE